MDKTPEELGMAFMVSPPLKADWTASIGLLQISGYLLAGDQQIPLRLQFDGHAVEQLKNIVRKLDLHDATFSPKGRKPTDLQ